MNCSIVCRLSAAALTAAALVTVSQGHMASIPSWALSAPSPGADGLRIVEVQANTFTSSTQENATLAADAAGNILIAWDSRRQHDGYYGVYARLFDGVGRPVSDEFPVSQAHAGRQFGEREPSVAFAADGAAWIAWSSYGHDGQAGSIVARRFAAGLASASDEINVNVTTAGHQHSPALAMNETGDLLVAWTDARDATSSIVARIFDSNGQPRTGELRLSTSGAAVLPSVAALPAGRFAVVWARSAADGTPNGIVGRTIDITGTPGDETVLCASAKPIEPDLTVADGSALVVTWHAAHADGHAVMLQRFNTDLAAAGDAVVVADKGWLSGAAVAADRDGPCTVLYNHFNVDGSRQDIFAQAVAADGSLVGPARRINQHRDGEQYLQIARNASRAVRTSHGALAVAWAGDSAHGDSSAANLTMFVPRDLDVPARPTVELAFAAPRSEAVAPIPPIYDPNWTPLPPLENAGGVGIDFGFEGVTQTVWTPPDPEIAVGPNHVVMMTNGAIAFYDKDGTFLFQDEIENTFGFWGSFGTGNFVFDPECLYDPHSGRFFAMACERTGGRSYFLLAASDDSNPVGTWHKYRIDVTFVDTDIDSPNFSVDEDAVYLTADFFGPDKFPVFAIDKNDVINGNPVTLVEALPRFTGSGNQSMGVPILYDTSVGAYYIIQSSEGTGNGITFSEVRFHAIEDPLGSPTKSQIDVTVPTYSYPNQPPQQGTSSRPFLFEPRFWSCQYIGGSLWAVHHVNGSRARARWYEFEMNGWPNGPAPTLRQSGELDYGGGIHTFFPSIAADAQGNACITFSRSSTSEFISMARAFRRHDDPLGTFRPMEFVKQSFAPHTSGRWGDYSGAEPDPASPDDFWIYHEWTQSGSWRTWVAQVQTGSGETICPDDANDFMKAFGGTQTGDALDLCDSDDVRLEVRQVAQVAPTLPFIRLEYWAHSSLVDNPITSLDYTVECHVSAAVPGGQNGNTLRTFIRNYNTGLFEQIDSRGTSSSSDEVITHTQSTNAPDYVNAGDGEVRVRQDVFNPGNVVTPNWFLKVDQYEVTVNK